MSTWIKFTVVLIGVLVVNVTSAQIEINSETTKTKKEKEKKEEKEKEMDNATSVFVHANWSYTTRKLIENDGLFGKPLGEREFETNSNAWSYTLGFRNQIHPNFAWQGAIAYMQNAESYSYEDVDTSFQYRTKYSYIAMPIKVYFTYGESIKLLAGAGIVPQMFIGYSQERTSVGPVSETIEETEKKTSGYNPFVLSAAFNLGTQIRLGGNWSFLFIPEYKVQLISSEEKNAKYKHFGRSLGFNFGILLDL